MQADPIFQQREPTEYNDLKNYDSTRNHKDFWDISEPLG